MPGHARTGREVRAPAVSLLCHEGLRPISRGLAVIETSRSALGRRALHVGRAGRRRQGCKPATCPAGVQFALWKVRHPFEDSDQRRWRARPALPLRARPVCSRRCSSRPLCAARGHAWRCHRRGRVWPPAGRRAWRRRPGSRRGCGAAGRCASACRPSSPSRRCWRPPRPSRAGRTGRWGAAAACRRSCMPLLGSHGPPLVVAWLWHMTSSGRRKAGCWITTSLPRSAPGSKRSDGLRLPMGAQPCPSCMLIACISPWQMLHVHVEWWCTG